MAIHDRWTKRKLVQQNFFIKWKQEYLANLEKNKTKQNKEKDIKVGSVVLLMNERHTKDTWPIARVEQVYRSKDGTTRSVKLRLPLDVSETTKKRATKGATKRDNKSVYVNSTPRFTTRGVENIAILEEGSVDDQHSQDEDNGERNTDTNVGSDGLVQDRTNSNSN